MTTNLVFTIIGRSDSGLTNIWQITSAHTGVNLGLVKWYGPWRRYAVFPETGTIYDAACLTEITDFLIRQMQVRKEQ